MAGNPEIALLEPNTEVMTCSVCGEMIWSHRAEPISLRMSIPSRSARGADALTLMHELANEHYLQTVTLPAEEAARKHFGEKHPIRFWLWERYGWDRVLRRWFR
jgi:hypothetical protein